MLEDTSIDIGTEALRDGLWVVRVPLPVRMDPVNCYVGERPDGGLVVVDAGYAVAAESVWRAALDSIGAVPADVAQIVITHFHPDHIGGSGPLARVTGAPVFGSELTVTQTPGIWGEDRVEGFARIDNHLLDHGFPAELVEQLGFELELAGVGVQLPERIGRLDLAQPLLFAGGSWEIVPTPGHADGHVCLLERESGELIAGDHLLQRISPAVGLFPGHAENPLGLYLDSLERVAKLPVRTVYPGHGAPFSGAPARCIELMAHHGERVEACLEPLAGGAQATGREISLHVFGTRHDPANQRFALTETLAHLELARARGRVQRTLQPDAAGRDVWRYRSA